MKMPKFGTRKALFGYFWTRIQKLSSYLASQICQFEKFGKIMKMSNFGAKNALIAYFWARISKGYCHIWNKYPRICVTAKFREKNENAQIWDKKCLIRVFLTWNFQKAIVIFEITIFEFA